MPRPAEITATHTRLLRFTLAVDESRAYWTHGDPTAEPKQEATTAFEERWFGGMSLVRIRGILGYLRTRYGRLAESFEVLQAWRDMEPATRRLICHWHVQFDDPIYRRFTDQWLLRRRQEPRPLDRSEVARWIADLHPGRWGEQTLNQFATKLLTAASEAGLVTGRRNPRKLSWPSVPDQAVAYLLYFLRGVEFEGTLTDNPYLRSVGLDEVALSDLVRRLPSVRWNRLGNVDEFTWTHDDLAGWARRSG